MDPEPPPVYGTPDPDYPLPACSVRFFSGSECADDDQLERWRMMNDPLSPTSVNGWMLEE